MSLGKVSRYLCQSCARRFIVQFLGVAAWDSDSLERALLMPFRYPISLELHDRRCVVIGGGEVAEHKARGLLEAGATVTVVAEEVSPGLKELVRRGELGLQRKPYTEGDLEGAFLAIAATDNPEVNEAIFREAERRKVLLNAVDDTRHCHFAVPAVVRRGDFLLAISTGGKAPALAKRLRRKLSAEFGSEYGVLVDLLGEVREEASQDRRVDFPAWAGRWQRALDHDLVGLVRRGRIAQAADLVRACLTGQAAPRSKDRPCPGRVAIVGAGPGDPGLITLRGKELLGTADVVVHDRLVHPSLLQGKQVVPVGKHPGGPHVSQDDINELLITLARRGRQVVRLKGGDPFVFGRGGEEAEALAAAGVDFEVVPAPTSATAALAYAGIPVTDRRLSSSVAFVTGHCAGGEIDWGRLAAAVDTVVVLMGLANLERIVTGLIEGGRPPTTPAAVVENGTLPDQRVVTADLGALPGAATQAGIRPPAVVVVGEVVRLAQAIAWFTGGPVDGADADQEATPEEAGPDRPAHTIAGPAALVGLGNM